MTRYVAVCVACLLAIAIQRPIHAAGKSVHVRGYTTKSGRYVPPHTRSAPRTSSRGYGLSVPDLAALSLPRDVPVKGYTRKDGTYVEPHMRHIDGIKDPEPASAGSRKSSLSANGHRTTHRTSARGMASNTKPKKQYPSREWRSSDGTILASGRMEWRAMNKLHIARDGGGGVDVLVEELSQDDQDWLEAAKRNPHAMKTETVDDDASDVPDSDDGSDAAGVDAAQGE